LKENWGTKEPLAGEKTEGFPGPPASIITWSTNLTISVAPALVQRLSGWKAARPCSWDVERWSDRYSRRRHVHMRNGPGMRRKKSYGAGEGDDRGWSGCRGGQIDQMEWCGTVGPALDCRGTPRDHMGRKSAGGVIRRTNWPGAETESRREENRVVLEPGEGRIHSETGRTNWRTGAGAIRG